MKNQSRAARATQCGARVSNISPSLKTARLQRANCFGGRRGIRFTAIADRARRRRNRVQPGYAAKRHSGVPSLVPLKKGSKRCLISFLAEGEGFALQRLPIGYAEGAIACSPGNAVRCPGFEHLAFFKNSPLVSGQIVLAEGEGFEPPDTCASTVFKTAAFDRSASLPQRKDYSISGGNMQVKNSAEKMYGVFNLDFQLAERGGMCYNFRCRTGPIRAQDARINKHTSRRGKHNGKIHL